MYSTIRSLILNNFPYNVSQLIYVGMIIFIITGFLSSKKWLPFLTTLVIAFIIGSLDYLILSIAPVFIVKNFINMIVLPFIITLFYSKR